MNSEMNLRTWCHLIPIRDWLLFNSWFSLLIVSVSASATLHVPIGRVAWPILVLCTGLAIALAVRSRHSKGWILQHSLATLLVLAAVAVVLRGSLFGGEFVSVYPDPWSYSTNAAYLQNPSPAIVEGSQLLSKYGAQVIGTRYATPGLLAFFAEIARMDTCRSACVYAFFVLADIGFGFALLARALRVGPVLSLGAGLFGIAVGWAPEILKIGNWDQVLFLSIIPFAVFRAQLLTFPTSRSSGIVGLGLCIAAAMFIYPEGAAISGVLYLPLVVWRLFHGTSLPAKIRRASLAAGFSILLSAVYLPTLVVYLARQLSAGTSVFMAKGALGGLLSANWLAAIYGLGAHLPATAVHPVRKAELLVVLVFLGLTLMAMRIWWKYRDGILVVVPMFMVFAAWQACMMRYDYGFYKVLTMFWPVMVAAIFVGMSRLLAWCRGVVRPTIAVAFCGLIAAAIFVEAEDYPYAPWRQERKIGPFLELTRLSEFSGTTPIRISTQNWFHQLWALFFLRGYTVEISHPLLYLQSVATMSNAGPSPQDSKIFVLTDERKPGAVWHNEIFSLLNREEPVEVIAIEAPNSVETVDGDSFVWLDNRFACLTVRSDCDRQAILSIPELRPGPSRPEKLQRTLVVDVNGQRREFQALGKLEMPIFLKKGTNLVRLACKEPATIHSLASGDPRILLLGIRGVDVRPE
jgi:hypothetical protein